MGYCYESYGIIVNKKLLKKAGYEITDIKDFASLKSVAEDIHKRADKLGFDAFTSSGMDDASSWRFTGHLANMPLFYEGRDDGWKEAPAEIKGTYLDNFKNVWDLYIKTANTTRKLWQQVVTMLKPNSRRAKQYSTRMVHGNMML